MVMTSTLDDEKMGKISKKIFFFLILTGLFFPGLARAGAGEVKWVSYPEGISRAAQANRPALVWFYARSCRVCGVLQKNVLSHPEIIDYLNAKLIPIKVDFSRERELVEQYRVSGVPIIYFLKPDSAPIDFIAGYVEPEKFLTIIRYIGEKAYEKTTYEEYLGKKGR